MARRVKIRRVVDGDSVEAQYGGLLGMMRRRPFPVRLYAIDAPELAQPNGAAARAHLQSLVRGGGSLRIEVMDTDRYGRRVALLYRGRGRRGRRNSVNAQMVQAGMAYWYGRYGGQELGLDRAEAEARRQRRGVWRRGGKGQRPWDYRSDRRNREGRRGGRWRWRRRLMLAVAVTLAAAVVLLVGIAYAAGPGEIGRQIGAGLAGLLR